MKDASAADRVVELTRSFAAPPGRVYDAWLDPKALQSWFPPKPWSMPSPAVDPRIGGGFRFELTNAETGISSVLTGAYTALAPGQRLEYDARAELPDGQAIETRVSVRFKATEGGCALHLRQEFFPNRELRDQWVEGWKACLAQLQGLVG